MFAKIKKKDPISAAEYVANKIRYTNKSKTDESFYDKHTIIDIENEDGSVSKGIIRISNHDVDMQKWADQNNNFDFGISFVFDDTINDWDGNDIVTRYERTICIYEYDFDVNGSNKQMLDVVISQILGIKIRKYFKFDTNIKGVTLNKRISKLQEAILSAIENAFKKLN